MISGATRLAGIIGDPVRHSLSPVLHNTAYAELGLDWVYLAFQVPAGSTAAARDSVRTLELVGLSVTMPHKTAAADACDERTDDAAALLSVNTVTRLPEGRLLGDSTDGEGFVRSLVEAGIDPAVPALVLGAGGSARVVARALQEHGATVTIAARRPEAAAALGTHAVPWAEREACARASNLIVNATPLGMNGAAAGEVPLSPDVLGSGQVVADLVYHPLETPLLAAAAAAGATTVDGLGMLVHQAALQIERWSGMSAPVAKMRAAALAVLS